MKYRKLRIAFSAGCGMLCLLLIALWVRSYSHADFVTHIKSVNTVHAYHSMVGRFMFVVTPQTLIHSSGFQSYEINSQAATGVPNSILGFHFDRRPGSTVVVIP
jgi:hypothetical protein